MRRGPRIPGIRRLFRLPASLRRVERDVDDELHFHIESRIRDLIAEGRSAGDARRQAEREYGDLASSRAELVEVSRRVRARERRADWIDIVRQDLGYAIRGLRRQPGFAFAVAATLALAIGANGAVIALIDPLLFRTPPGISDPGALRRFYTNHPFALTRPGNVDPVGVWFSYPEFREIRRALEGSARVAAYWQWDSTSAVRGVDTLVASLTYATADLLPLLGVRAATGRLFDATEDDLNAPSNVIVVSRRFARRAFGEDANPLGQAIVFRSVRYSIVGVADASFGGIDWTATDAWAPLSTHPKLDFGNRRPWYESSARTAQLVVRLTDPEVSDRGLEAIATTALRRVFATTHASEADRSVLTGPILTARGPMRAPRQVAIATRLFGVSIIVLVIACANVANLLLARALRRRREIAVRLALGISRTRLTVQLVLESVTLAALGGAAAVVVATWTGAVLRLALLPRVRWVSAPVGLRVVVACIALTLVAGIVAGIVPAILATRASFIDALKSGVRDGAARRPRVQTALLVAQVGLAVVLVVGAVLFSRSLNNVRGVDLGYRTKALLAISISFADRAPHPEVASVLPQAMARFASMPGVLSASYSVGAPLDSWMSVPLLRAGADSAIRMASEPSFLAVSPGYFATTGTRILAGRGFTAADNSEPVMIVSGSMAKALWPDGSPLGECLIPLDRARPCHRIVGVAADAHTFRIIETPGMQFYFPVSQSPVRSPPRSMLVHVKEESFEIAEALRAELRAMLPGAQIAVRSMTNVLEPQLRPWRLSAQLFGGLSMLALVVASIGVYSVIAFGVRQRLHEMGVRLALGARPVDLVRLVVGQGTAVVALGVVLGVVAALAAGRLVASQLYGVTPRDPAALAASASFLLVVGAMASLFPAWRASRVDPARVLRDD